MSQKEVLKPGTYTTKVKGHHADLNSNGKPYAVIYFENGARYQGYFVGGATEWTTNNLIAAGFKGRTPNDLNVEGALDTVNPVEIVVENEVGEDGKNRAIVKFVNKPFKQKEINASSIATLQGIDLGGYMAEAGIKPQAQQRQATSNAMFDQAPPHDDSDLPPF